MEHEDQAFEISIQNPDGFWLGRTRLEHELSALEAKKDFYHCGEIAVRILEHYSGQVTHRDLIQLHGILKKVPTSQLPEVLKISGRLAPWPALAQKTKSLNLERLAKRQATLQIFLSNEESEIPPRRPSAKDPVLVIQNPVEVQGKKHHS